MGLWSIIVKSFKEPTIRKKIFMTLLLILIFRIGCFIPVPGIGANALEGLTGTGLGQFWDLLTGGAMSNASLFAMGISPYINASIIIQLLTVAIPAFEKWQKEGPEGRKRLSRITKYTAAGLALFQAIMLYINMKSGNVTLARGFEGTGGTILLFLFIVLSFVAGTSFLTWLGDKITEVGIGNGISMLIFAGIIARAPQWIGNLFQIAINGGQSTDSTTGAPIYVAKEWYQRTLLLFFVILIFLVVIVSVVWMESGERRLGVVYAQRVVGRKVMGGQKSYIPLKVNSAGVLPIIFAMSLLQFPGTIASLINNQSAAAQWFANSFTNQWWYIVLYALLIIGFTFFYNMVYFDPKEYANNIIQNGGQLTEVRSSNRKATAQYIGKIQRRLTWFGSIFLAILAILPNVLGKICDVIPGINPGSLNLWLGGTSILIMVGVALETVRTLETQLMMRHYKAGKGGFLG